MRPEESPPDFGGSDRAGHRQRRLRVVKPETVHIRLPGTTGGKQFDDFPFRSVLEAL